jgi:hypothetical protein
LGLLNSGSIFDWLVDLLRLELIEIVALIHFFALVVVNFNRADQLHFLARIDSIPVLVFLVEFD